MRIRLSAITLASAMLAAPVMAGDLESAQQQITSKLSKAIPGLEIKAISDSVLPGLFEVQSNNDQMLYVTQDASHFVVGDVYQVAANELVNVTEKKREALRADALNAIPEQDMIVFAPEKTKATITVFTDIDCVYCRKLHQDVPRLNELGIKVRYLAYPRAGLQSPSYSKAVSAWCAGDPQQALTDAKAGKSIPGKTCENSIKAQFELGQKVGVTGTPAIILESGELVRGYLPADSLAKGMGIL
ncbi:protein-disulfide isomerase [Oleiphilus messinensis]|uniref:Thiol:disulfide interchange protein n=1 Tax=Oleiphilus messinensis TaxID=141451 RepID=A0A1Y0I711_9GAMM|nr:thioredoxin fold domain-containing protein [Oleiphilus messinensis]ARU55305.1 protein-disulfide isomerase [Oleiphilus messinensis]